MKTTVKVQDTRFPRLTRTMKAQHTPGPWSVFHQPEQGRIRVGHSINSESADFVATVFDGPRKAANSRLIAAAPELLAMLQRLTHPAADDGDVRDALTLIAKATGEPAP